MLPIIHIRPRYWEETVEVSVCNKLFVFESLEEAKNDEICQASSYVELVQILGRREKWGGLKRYRGRIIESE